jgi:hypothetical protein
MVHDVNILMAGAPLAKSTLVDSRKTNSVGASNQCKKRLHMEGFDVKKPPIGGLGRLEILVLQGSFGGRYWDRTSGFHRVKVALYR